MSVTTESAVACPPKHGPRITTDNLPPQACRLPEDEATLRLRASHQFDTRGSQLFPIPSLPGFELLDRLGKGGSGIVFRARQTSLDRIVALKVLADVASAKPDELRREAEAIARLQHPNIVQIHEVGEHGHTPYLCLEYCAGGSLADRLDGVPWKAYEAAGLIETLARAVHAAHRAHLLHRDLKPGNILLTWDGVPKVGDFGLARFLDQAGPSQSTDLRGTPCYMAPEQAIRPGAPLTPAADVYALGTMLYELLTGRPPFRAATAVDTVNQVLNDEPVPMRHLQPTVSRDVENICHKCLHKDPRQRYATAEALADDLVRFQRGEPVVARPVGALGRAARWARRRPAIAGLSFGMAVSVIVGMTVSVFFAIESAERAVVAEESANVAVAEMTRADDARQEAESARSQTQRQIEIAEGERDLAFQRLYVGDVRLMPLAWSAGDLPRLAELLEGQMPERTGGKDLRGFEWYYWRHMTKSALHTLAGHVGPVRVVALHPGGGEIATGGTDGTVRLWDLASGSAKETLSAFPSGVLSVGYSVDGKRIAASGKDGTIKIWALPTGQPPLTLSGHKREVRGIAFAPAGDVIASAGADNTIRFWSTLDGHAIRTIEEAHCGPVNCFAYHPNGRLLASGSDDHNLRLWDLKDSTPPRILMGHHAKINGLAFNRDGSRIATASTDTTVRVWDAIAGKELTVLHGHTGAVQAVAFSPEGTRLATASVDNTIRLWSPAYSTSSYSTLRGTTAGVASLQFTPRWKLVGAAADGNVRVWNAFGWESVEVSKTVTTGVLGLRTGPDKTVSVFAGAGLSFRWQLGKGTIAKKIPTPRKLPSVKDVRSADGKWRAVIDGTAIRITEAATGAERATLKGHVGLVRCLAFGPDGRRLASGGDDKCVRVWSTESGQEVLALQGHAKGVRQVAFTPDGLAVVSGSSSERMVKMWVGE